MEQTFEVIDIDKMDKMNEVSANVHYQIALGFDESDAEGTIRALVEKYPALVIKVLSKRYIKNLATLEAMETFMKGWKA